MQPDTPFRIILALLFIGFIGHRAYYTRKFPPEEKETLDQQRAGVASQVAAVLAIPGLLALLIFVALPEWIAWASLPFPLWLRWLGVVLALAGFGLLQWSHHALGRNWSDTPRITSEQELVTEGPYRWIRHPIYTAFLLILGSSLFISANWLVGGLWIGMTAVDISARVAYEEEKMFARFGEEYRSYRRRTGRLLPRF